MDTACSSASVELIEKVSPLRRGLIALRGIGAIGSRRPPSGTVEVLHATAPLFGHQQGCPLSIPAEGVARHAGKGVLHAKDSRCALGG